MSTNEVTAGDYYRYYDLEQDPFPVGQVDGIYYPSPELEHRIELARHLIDFSNRIVLVTGSEGSGKTAFLQHLEFEADERWAITRLDITGGESPEYVLQSIYLQNHLDYHPGEPVESCVKTLKHHFQNNIDNNLVNVFLVDNAHRLPASVLNLLLQFATPSTGGQAIHLVMMSEEDISSLFLNQDDEFLHKMELPLLSEDQLPVYLRHRLGNCDLDFDRVFNAQQLKQIHKTSGGIPAIVNQLAARTLQDPSQLGRAKRPAKKIPLLGLLLNGRFTLGLSLVLVAVFVVMVLNREEAVKNEVINLPLPEITPAPETAVIPEPVAVNEESAMPGTGPKNYVDDSSEADVTDESDAQADIRGEPASVVETITEPVPPAVTTAPEPLPMTETATPVDPMETVDAGDEPVLVISKTEPVTIPEPEPVPKPAATPNAPGFRGADWLKQQSPEQYVLQLIGAHDPDVINKVLSANPSVYGKVARFTTVNNNKRWHVLVYGLYPDRDKAVANIPDLPKNLRALGPWPRSVASIQADLR